MPLKERYSPRNLPYIVQSLSNYAPHLRSVAPDGSFQGRESVFLAEVDRGERYLLPLTKVTKGGRAFREETDNVYRSYLRLHSDLSLSAPPRRIILGE